MHITGGRQPHTGPLDGELSALLGSVLALRSQHPRQTKVTDFARVILAYKDVTRRQICRYRDVKRGWDQRLSSGRALGSSFHTAVHKVLGLEVGHAGCHLRSHVH